MKKNEDMNDTNRMAIKLENDVKIMIDRKYIDDEERYLIKFSNNVKIKGVRLPKDSFMLLDHMHIDKDSLTLQTLVLENVGLRIVWVNNDGYLNEFVSSYSIEPEEKCYCGDLTLYMSKIKEISTDLDMFDSMMQNGMIDADNFMLSSFGLSKPNLKVLDGGKVKSKKVVAKTSQT